MNMNVNPPKEHMWGPDCACQFEKCPCEVTGT